MDMESSSSNTMAKLPILKQGEFEMWKLRIKSFFMMMDYALWEVIESGNSWVSQPTEKVHDDGTKSMIMTVPVTNEEKLKIKNDNKARSVLLMALPYEHHITFDQYADAKSMFKATEARFGGNASTRRTQKNSFETKLRKLHCFKLRISGFCIQPTSKASESTCGSRSSNCNIPDILN
ncbi:hypothetical protein OROGR_023796 [Orobanche gracilis]